MPAECGLRRTKWWGETDQGLAELEWSTVIVGPDAPGLPDVLTIREGRRRLHAS